MTKEEAKSIREIVESLVNREVDMCLTLHRASRMTPEVSELSRKAEAEWELLDQALRDVTEEAP